MTVALLIVSTGASVGLLGAIIASAFHAVARGEAWAARVRRLAAMRTKESAGVTRSLSVGKDMQPCFECN